MSATFSDFGKISGYDEPTMISFANERGANTEDQRLRNPLDFILWQKSEDKVNLLGIHRSAPDDPDGTLNAQQWPCLNSVRQSTFTAVVTI